MHLPNLRLLPFRCFVRPHLVTVTALDPGAPRGGARLGPRRPRGPDPPSHPHPRRSSRPLPAKGARTVHGAKAQKGPGGSARSAMSLHLVDVDLRADKGDSTQSTRLQACAPLEARAKPVAGRGARRTTSRRGPEDGCHSAPPTPPTSRRPGRLLLCGARQPRNHVGSGHPVAPRSSKPPSRSAWPLGIGKMHLAQCPPPSSAHGRGIHPVSRPRVPIGRPYLGGTAAPCASGSAQLPRPGTWMACPTRHHASRWGRAWDLRQGGSGRQTASSRATGDQGASPAHSGPSSPGQVFREPGRHPEPACFSTKCEVSLSQRAPRAPETQPGLQKIMTRFNATRPTRD